MPADSARDCRCVVSRSSSVRVPKVDRAELREALVDRVDVRCVRANAVQCIRRAACRLPVDVRWAEDARWVDVRWALDRDYLRRERRRGVRVRVRELRDGVRDSVIRLLAASKKDR